MYGAETWALKKAQEKKLEVAEMRMIRWMCGVTKLDKIRNERKRGTTKVGETARKLQERRLRWKVQGRRKGGIPKRRWLDKVKVRPCYMEAYVIVLRPHIQVGIR